MLECVINISEGRDTSSVAAVAEAAAHDLLDVHTDAHHNRSVLTVVGEDAPRAVTRAVSSALDPSRRCRRSSGGAIQFSSSARSRR